MPKNIWQDDELIVALNLYWKIPYNKISGTSNKEIKEVAKQIGRSPSGLAFKLMNYTSLDSERQSKGNKGKDRGGNKEEIIWEKYFNKWDELAFDSTKIISKITHKPIEDLIPKEEETFALGKEKERTVRVRINQSDFRQRILASYNEKCCITGINIPILLVASHIIPWSENEIERLNPQNGLCLNSIHDKAFDRGLLTITDNYKIRLSKDILKKKNDEVVKHYFIKYENQSIILPDRYKPNLDFLAWHHTNRFEK